MAGLEHGAGLKVLGQLVVSGSEIPWNRELGRQGEGCGVGCVS